MRGESLGRLKRPLYSFAEADRLARVSRGTSRRWLVGYRYRTEDGLFVPRPPVSRSAVEPFRGVSFLDLVEVVAIGGLKGIGFSLPKIREIVDYCRKAFAEERPLVTLTFKTDGRDVFVKSDLGLVQVLGSRKGAQAWDQVLGPFLDTLDYQDEVARRWWPLGRSEPVVVDPDFGFGLPVIAGSGVRTEIVLERFNAGETEDEIARDFNIEVTEARAALRFETQRLAA